MEVFWSNLTLLAGFPSEILILTLVLTAAGKKNWRRILIAILAFSLFRLVGEILKEGTAVPRACWQSGVKTLIPCPESFSFPSGHALGATMVAVITSLIYRRKLIVASTWITAILIAISRVVVGVHSPIDVIGGGIIGVISGLIVWKFYWD
ncbi:phosphatase PAP2 family protein [Candidatus Collierbacteria bacterium]|nr:phosphatase PAP2 family protein [Candidatus Collierbacteria bacterium]